MALYWVWGTWNWSDATNHWATTSGGAPWAGNLPTATDDVFFDSASNATAYTVTIDATTKLCRDITFGAPLTWNMTWAWSVAMNISWSFTAYNGLIRTYTGIITFNSTATGKTITMNTVTLASTIEINWVWWWWTLQDDFTTTWWLNQRNWTLDTNGKTVATADYLSLTGTHTLTLWASTWNINGWFQVAWTLTFNPNTSTINILGNNAQIVSWWRNFNIVNVTVWSAATSFTDSASVTYATLTITWWANKTWSVTISWPMTVTWTFTATWNSAINRLLISSNTKWTARTITAAAISVDKVDFQDITGAGAASWNMSAAAGYTWDCWGNTMQALGSAAFTTAATCNWSAGATWSTATWSSRVPLPQDTATFTTAWVATITQDMPRIWSVDFSTSSNKTWTTSTVCSFFGSINLTNLTALTASTQTYNYEWRSSSTLTSAWFSFAKNIGINAPGWTLTLWDIFSSTGQIVLTSGTFTTNNFNATCSSVNTTNSNVRTFNLWSSTLTLTDIGTIWNAATSTNLTLNAGTSTIKATNTTASARTFAGWWKTYNNFWHAGWAGWAALTISWSNTFADFKDDGSVAHSILFTAGTTQTVTTFTVNGTAWNLITLNSTTTATHALVKSWGWTITCNYLNIQHSVATPWSTWTANNSTNNQSVATAGSGWSFWWVANTWSWFFMCF